MRSKNPGGNADERQRNTMFSGGTILLVEDNPDDVELTMRALKQTGFTNLVVTLRDGAQAIDYLMRRGDYARRQDDQPALILLDLKLPRVDGLEVLGQIKSDPALKILPVIMFTSSRQERDVNQAYVLGVNSYVCKPTGLVDFTSVVRALGDYWFGIVEMPPDGKMRLGDRPN